MPKIAANFELGSAQPIDSRFVVATESDLNGLKVYEGLEVYIKDTKLKKRYNGSEWVDMKADLETEEAGFVEIGTSSTINIESDTQVPTSKAVQTLIDGVLGDIETLLEAI